MNYIRINPITETDFDSIVRDAGGFRIEQEDSADYVLSEAILELKLVEEEGLAKKARQEKLAKLFKAQQPDAPVVVLDPQSLGQDATRTYYDLMKGPIQTHVKKAASQLRKTRSRFTESSVSVLILFNNGYSALTHEEFKSICFKCVTNDTKQVDWLIVGGLYFHSDTFDNYMIAPFEPIPINLSTNFSSVEKLGMAWSQFIDNFMTRYVREEMMLPQGKMPVLDMVFEVEKTKFVKPAPRLGNSVFWPEGERPRTNTSGIESCPPVARILPFIKPRDWNKFKELFPFDSFFKETYLEWIYWVREMEMKWKDIMKPLVTVSISFQEFEIFIKPGSIYSISDFWGYSIGLFEEKIRMVMNNIQDSEKLKIVVPEYIHLEVAEIGHDKAFDLCSIFYVSEVLVPIQQKIIVNKVNIFFEYGVALASAYAVKKGVSTVIYTRKRLYS